MLRLLALFSPRLNTRLNPRLGLRLLSSSLCLWLAATACIGLWSTFTAAANISPNPAQTQLSPHDELFLSLRDASQKNHSDAVDKLSGQLPSNYPLHAFGEYWKLKVRLPNVSDAQMVQFIKRYDGQFVADRLRNDWLLILARRGDWKQFDEQLPLFGFADDPQVDCYALLSKANQGLNVKIEARFLAFRNPSHLAGEGCLALVEGLYKAQQFQAADVWDAIHVLAEGKRVKAALQLAVALKTKQDVVEQIVTAPSTAFQQKPLNIDKQVDKHSHSNLHQLALAALARGGYWGKEVVTAHAAVQGAAACALRLGNDCNSWFKPGGHSVKLPATLEGLGSDNALEWSVRGALRAQDWALVVQLTQRLPPHLKTDAAWTYWHAKGLQMMSQMGPMTAPAGAPQVVAAQVVAADTARILYERIATGYGFYNLLAREALGQGLPILPAHGIALDEALVKTILAKGEVQRMQTFFKLGLRWEGNREWNWMIRGQDDTHLLHYAEAGRRLGHLDRMINSADRSKSQIDFKQRYPMPFFNQAQAIADGLNLDSHWVYGLMRQESRFISDIRSSVSARGLMQIMPATAAYVAKKINMPNYSLDRLIDPDINLTLGHHYLAMVLADLDNSPILATAAYNAGPSRSKTWRASLASTADGALFAETIPFNETRGYVKQVFANAVMYGVLSASNANNENTARNKPRLVSQWLGVVPPKAASVTTLP